MERRAGGLEEVGVWIQETLGARTLTDEKLAVLLKRRVNKNMKPEMNQVDLEMGGLISTVARLVQVPQDQIFGTDKPVRRRIILAQRGILPDSIGKLIEESGLGTVQWKGDYNSVVQELSEMKRRFKSGELKWNPGEPKPVFLVSPETIDRLEREGVWSDMDGQWRLPLFLLGVSGERLYPANLPAGSEFDTNAVLSYLQALFSWADLLPGRVVEQVKGSFLDNRHQTLFLSIAA